MNSCFSVNPCEIVNIFLKGTSDDTVPDTFIKVSLMQHTKVIGEKA